MVRTEQDAETITCAFCQRTFTEDLGQPTCQGCPLAGACRFVRCPHCGYENPVAPAWVDRVKRWIGGGDDH